MNVVYKRSLTKPLFYSLHAEDKLTLGEIRKLKISKREIERILKRPEAIDRSEKPVLIAMGELTKTVSLCVVYKRVTGGVKVITFYPAERGRYERKILQRG